MRTTKLMALLLAALMVVAAFAGCASGVKQDEFDGLEDRVGAIEDKINGVQESIDKIPANDNKETLDQITNTLAQISDKLTNVENRVTEVEKNPTTGATADAAAKEAAQKATATIELKKNEFAKLVDEYSAEDYKAIVEALGAATSAVNAATTVADVDKAMADLEAALDQYTTYAMKAYEYYTKLLGGVNADAEALVEEVKAFLEDVESEYNDRKFDITKEDFEGLINDEEPDSTLYEYEYKLLYLAEEGKKASGDVYINMYAALDAFVSIFEKDDSNLYTIPYVDEKGKYDEYEFYCLAYYAELAEEIDEDIEDTIGEELIYSSDLEDEDSDLNKLFAKYDAYVEEVEILGGDKLVALVTKADALAAAEDAFDNLMEAVDAFDDATVISRTNKQNVFYYYDKLLADNAEKLLSYTYEDSNDKDVYVWVADEYEKVDEILNDWIDDYDLSEENVLAILEAKGYDDDYYTKQNVKYNVSDTDSAHDTYVANKHYNDLLVAACDEFKNDIVPLINKLNKISTPSVDLALQFGEVEALIDELWVLQKADKDAEYPANIALADVDADNQAIIYKEADLFAAMNWSEEIEEDRYDAIVDYIDLFTFNADVKQLSDRNADKYYFADEDDASKEDNRANGDIYDFLAVTMDAIYDAAKVLNDAIADFVEDVNNNSISDNAVAVELEGNYVKLEGTEDAKVSFAGKDYDTTIYVELADYLKDVDVKLDDYMEDVDAEDSINAFLYFHKDFKALLNLDEFEAAKKTLADRIDGLFADIYKLVDLVEAVEYVRKDEAVFYEDLDGDGEYDAGEEVDYDLELVSLNDAAAVKAATAAHTAWVYAGGSIDIAYFGDYVDGEGVAHDDVYTMIGLTDVDDIDDAIDMLATLENQIATLEEAANRFVKAVANAKKVHSATPFVAKLDASETNGLNINITTTKDETKYFAWTARKISNDDTVKNEYTIVNKDTPWTLNTHSIDTKKTDVEWLTGNALTKKELLMDIVVLYDDFKDVNIEYELKADKTNVADDGIDDYYQVVSKSYAAYKAFDDAVKDYEALDILSIKAYILGVVTQADRTDSRVATFRTQINNAKTYAEIQNAIYNYNADAADKIYASGTANFVLDAYTVYDFTRLPVPEV